MVSRELPHLRDELKDLKLSIRPKRYIAGKMKLALYAHERRRAGARLYSVL